MWDSKHGIALADRQPLIQLVKSMVFARSANDLGERYNALINITPDSYSSTYPQLIPRLEQFWERREEWALSYRVEKMMRGNHTNNYSESGIRILKEIIFGRVKAYNLIQMFEFITEKYYTNRLLDIAHSRYRPNIALRFKDIYESAHSITTVVQIRDSIYCVAENLKQIGELEFTVDMEIGTCSCLKGCTGSACRHQAAVAKQYNVNTITISPFHSKEARRMFAVLARGEDNVMGIDFYADLCDTSKHECGLNAATDDSIIIADGKVYLGSSDSDTVHPSSSDADLGDDMDLDETDDPNTHDPWKELLLSFQSQLLDTMDDMMDRLQQGDHNMISGVNKFLKTYKSMLKSHSPTATISYALHNFGKPDSKL